MLPPRWRPVLAGLLSCALLSLAPLHATAADGDTIVGSDGQTYPASPGVVKGKRGELFYGRSFDTFCADGSGQFEQALGRLAKLSKVIRRAHKRVVFVIAPDKAVVLGRNLIRPDLPHGACDKRGIRAHSKLLDTYPDRSHLPIRKPLAQDRRRIFWKTDTHWTTIGAAVFAKTLATKLDPALGARQVYKPGKPETRLMPMAVNSGSDKAETVPSLRPAGGIKVRTAKGSVGLHDGDYVIDYSWVSKPAAKTWPGRTLFLGDSFTHVAIENLRPVFHKGRFMWINNVTQDEINAAVVKADTVVIEVAEFFATVTPLGTEAFRTSVRDALKAAR